MSGIYFLTIVYCSLDILNYLSCYYPEFDEEIKELLIEVDKLIEKKKSQWKQDLDALENDLSLKISENVKLQKLIAEKEQEVSFCLFYINFKGRKSI